MNAQELEASIALAAAVIRSADALLIGAGAGMGVDSGLPDFRGDQGFWKAYPAFQGRRFAEMSNPDWFFRDPELAWGFFGHRYELYRNAQPHAGFEVLRRWANERPLGAFVFTSNVDGQFQKALFSSDLVVECHGSILHLQCARNCTAEIWPAVGLHFEIDATTIRCRSPLPSCPVCGGIARPNILMFGDGDWLSRRTDEQLARYESWLARTAGRSVVAIELGAGLAIPTVRRECEARSTQLIRINPREFETPPGGISLALSGLQALRAIARELTR